MFSNMSLRVRINLALFASLLDAASVQQMVVTRDHLRESSSESLVTGRAGDTTAGSWMGGLPGRMGLPTDPVPQDPPWIAMRRPLVSGDSVPGWPGRAVVRLDRLGYDSVFYPRCSGVLVGPKWVMSGAHCLVRPTTTSGIQEEWYADSFFVRPSFDRGRDYPGFKPVRVIRTTVSRTQFPSLASYAGDNDWALLELEADLGTSLGWAQVYPMESNRDGRNVHMLGYPVIPEKCRTGIPCDTVSKKDTLCHSWGPLDKLNQGQGVPKDWIPLVPAWQGESGSAILDCLDDACVRGPLRTRGTRWTIEAINAFDSTMSGVLAKLLEDVKVPVSAMRSPRHSEPGLRTAWTATGLAVETDLPARIEVLDAQGRNVFRTGPGTSWTLGRPAQSGVVLVVARYANGLTRSVKIASTRE